MGKSFDDSAREIDFSRNIHPKYIADPRFTQLKELMNELEKDYHISSKDLLEATEQNINVPISIYNSKDISALEATVRYLKENLNLRYKDIAVILNRDERTIWTTYSKSNKKLILDIDSDIDLPIQVLKDRNYSVLESITAYLKEEQSLRYNEIGKLLSLDQRTIWTCYNRFLKKRGDKNE
ncbi:hypothetical protein C0585_00025 [Candidatus Woesearchaeota archaeon]|nr:MAG: hypothetical protein C0585_00025 [Candidatus Woesearchaeota archaeon]